MEDNTWFAFWFQTFTAYFVNDGVGHAIQQKEVKLTGHFNQLLATSNTTHLNSFPVHKNDSIIVKEQIHKATLATIVTVGTLNIVLNLALLVCSIVNKARFSKLLLAWVGWTTLLIMLNCIMIVFYMTKAESFLDGTRVFLVYGCGILLEVFCIWVVASYYRYMLIMARGPSQGYRIVFNSRSTEPHAMFGSEQQIAISAQPGSHQRPESTGTSMILFEPALQSSSSNETKEAKLWCCCMKYL